MFNNYGKRYVLRSIFILLLAAIGWYLNVFIRLVREKYQITNPVGELVLGSAPSFVASFFVPLIMTLVLQSKRPTIEGGQVVLGLLVYEVAQIWFKSAYFDFTDLVFCLLGYIFFVWVVSSNLGQVIYKKPRVENRGAFH